MLPSSACTLHPQHANKCNSNSGVNATSSAPRNGHAIADHQVEPSPITTMQTPYGRARAAGRVLFTEEETDDDDVVDSATNLLENRDMVGDEAACDNDGDDATSGGHDDEGDEDDEDATYAASCIIS
mmetsp:Transcript_3781/g.8505  ORF Transcript_3781/g.8505 Transcript_3781/m.8505 type:complete len:127 (+) Transcript_3781:231-611(+)